MWDRVNLLAIGLSALQADGFCLTMTANIGTLVLDASKAMFTVIKCDESSPPLGGYSAMPDAVLFIVS